MRMLRHICDTPREFSTWRGEGAGQENGSSRTAYSNLRSVKVGLVAYRGWTAYALQLFPKVRMGSL
jgi:hypothetical protein